MRQITFWIHHATFCLIFPTGYCGVSRRKVHLHIFERYKQLVNECYEAGKLFGIPTVVNERVQEMECNWYGVTDIVQTYTNGEMDIKVTGYKDLQGTGSY